MGKGGNCMGRARRIGKGKKSMGRGKRRAGKGRKSMGRGNIGHSQR